MIWKTTNEVYEVSDSGDVRRIGSEKALTPFKDKDGYLVVNLSFGATRKRKSIARLVADAFIPNPENKPLVNHKNGRNKTNNSVDNLEWSTVSENTQHAFDTGLIVGHLTRERDSQGKFL